MMKKRTIIIAIIVILLILAVILIPHRPAEPAPTEDAAVESPVAVDPSPSPTAEAPVEVSSEPSADPAPQVTDTPELGGDEEVIIEIGENEGVGGL